MAGGGIKINNIKLNGGADGATFIPSVSSEGVLSWTNDKGYTNPTPVNIKGADGGNGVDGATGAKLVSQVLQGQDANGGNIYLQTFDDGTTATFTAPKGEKGNKGDMPSIAQTTGQSTTEVMSQKAITDELNGKANKADLEQTSAKLDALWKLNEGISYDFVTVNASAYENDIPSGAKKAAIEMIGGYNKQVGMSEWVNADVESVKVRGTNMFDEDLLLTATGWTKENGVYKGRANYIYNPNILSSLVFASNTQYYISYNVTQIGAKKFRVAIEYTDGTTETIYNSAITKSGKTVSKMRFDYGTNGTVELSNIIIAKSSVAVDYVPYILNTYSIPEAVRMLTDYGWGSYDNGTDKDVYNSIERTENGWQYVHRMQWFGGDYPPYGIFEPPGITDITDLMASFPNNFTVEPYGTITFVNSSGIDMPNTIKYLRALAEVK